MKTDHDVYSPPKHYTDHYNPDKQLIRDALGRHNDQPDTYKSPVSRFDDCRRSPVKDVSDWREDHYSAAKSSETFDARGDARGRYGGELSQGD